MTTKTCSKCKEVKPLDEFYKDRTKKDGLRGACKGCCDIKSKEYCAENAEAIKISKRKYCAENAEVVGARKRKWYAENAELTKARSRKRYAENTEMLKTDAIKWRKNNPDKRAANNARRRAAKLNRTPAWANKKSIQEVYRQAKLLSILTGIPYHVDHIVPLQGENVSGLHVEYNLEPMPAHENLIKHNSFDSDQ